MDIVSDYELDLSPTLYGKYKNIKETTVRLFQDVHIIYYLLKGRARTEDADVYSILCVKLYRGITEECEFAFDVSSKRDDAAHIYDVLCRNAVTPCCLFEALENIIYDTL